jgi:hypothetical protein
MKHKPINVLMFMRLAITLILILLFIEGLLGARSYSNSTYGCGYDDFIAADPKTALIYLLLSLPLAFFIFVNITSILKGEKNVPKKWYTRLWLQILIAVIIIIVSIFVAIGSPQFLTGYCF